MIHYLIGAAGLGLVAWVVGEVAGAFTRLAALVIRTATRLLPDAKADRWQKEWLAELDAVPGLGIVKLRWALNVTAGAGVMAYEARATRPKTRRRSITERLAPQSDELFAIGLILLLVAAYLAQKERTRDASGKRAGAVGRSTLSGSGVRTSRQPDLIVSNPPFGAAVVECKTQPRRPGRNP